MGWIAKGRKFPRTPSLAYFSRKKYLTCSGSVNSGVGLSGVAEDKADEDPGALEYMGGPVDTAGTASGIPVVGEEAGEPLDF